MSVKLIRYSDPERKSLAHAAAVYLGKSDTDNVKRPLNIIRKGDTLTIFRGEYARFEFESTKIVYDHLMSYTTYNMRACGGLRANVATKFVPPAEDNDPLIEELGNNHLKSYQSLIEGINPNTSETIQKKRLQAARSIAPMSVTLHYIFEFNFATLIEAIFPQRIWLPGAQLDTKLVVDEMYRLVHEQDPELWNLVYEYYGPEALSWGKVGKKIKKDNPKLYYEMINKYGNIESMWDKEKVST